MAKSKTVAQNREDELAGKVVTVKRPIQKDGLLDGGGWTETEVPAMLALDQLALPKEKRNAHFRNVVLVADVHEEEVVAAVGGKKGKQ